MHQLLDPESDAQADELGAVVSPAATTFTSQIQVGAAEALILLVHAVGTASTLTVTVQDSAVSGSGFADTAMVVTKSSFSGVIKIVLFPESTEQYIRLKVQQSGLVGVVSSVIRLGQRSGFTPDWDHVGRKT